MKLLQITIFTLSFCFLLSCAEGESENSSFSGNDSDEVIIRTDVEDPDGSVTADKDKQGSEIEDESPSNQTDDSNNSGESDKDQGDDDHSSDKNPDTETVDNDTSSESDSETVDDHTDGEPFSDDDQSQPGGDEPLVAEIVEPAGYSTAEAGNDLIFKGKVTDQKFPENQLSIRWISDKYGIIASGNPDSEGNTQVSTNKLQAGYHNITLEVTNPDGIKSTDQKLVGICKYKDPETFDSNALPEGWKIFKDAKWTKQNENGYLEMTGNEKSKKGMIYNIAEKVYPGDISIKFKIRTGPNKQDTPDNSGADGFAMSVVNLENVEQLEAYINTVQHGGGLGYAVQAPFGTNSTGNADDAFGGENIFLGEKRSAFHIEFDTWQNHEGGSATGDPAENHIAIMIDGQATDHKLISKTHLEDNLWHDIQIKTNGENIKVYFDGVVKIDGNIPNFGFRGGYIVFSGSTGLYTNYHSFDDLVVVDKCIVPQI